MMSKRLAGCVIWAAATATVGGFTKGAGGAETAGDPYAEIATLDYGKKNPIQAIADEVRATPPARYAEVEAKLIAAASKPDATLAGKRLVADLLRIVGSKASVSMLTKWMGDAKTVDLAAFALQGLPGKDVDEAIATARRGQTGRVRAELGLALAARGYAGVIADLAKDAAGTDAELAHAAVMGLGRLGTDEAVAALRGLKAAEPIGTLRLQVLADVAHRRATEGKGDAAKALWKDLAGQSQNDEIAGAALRDLATIDPKGALAEVVAALKDKRLIVARAAAAAAAKIPGAEATQKLAAALSDAPAPVAVVLLGSLAQRKDKTAFPAVKAAMGSADVGVVVEAIRACETLADGSMVQPLIELASSGGAKGEAAQYVLARLAEPGIDAALVKQLDGDKPEVAAAAAGTLAARGHGGAVPQLLKLLAHKDAAVRSAAFKALDVLAGSDEVPGLLALLPKASDGDRDKVRSLIWNASAGVADKEERFLHLWKTAPADAHTRTLLLPLAAQGAGTGSLAVVKAELASPDTARKEAAHRALFAWSTDFAAETTLEVLKSTDKLTYRVLAARSLATRLDKRSKLPNERRQAMLREALAKMERPDDKKMVEAALQKVIAEREQR